MTKTATFTKPAKIYGGYIFDCDGTLANSVDLHYTAWQHALKLHGAKFDFTWEMFRSTAGMGLAHMVELINKKYNENFIIEEILFDQEKYVDDHLDTVTANEAIKAFAKEVAGMNKPRCVASGGHRVTVHETLKIIGVTDYFPLVFTQEDVEVGKPAPDMFLLAAEKMGVTPEECLVIEDSILGIEAANAAGMASILVEPEHKCGNNGTS